MKRFLLLCLCLFPFLLNAQFNTNLTLKALPGVTTTKILIPIGFEFQPNPSFGILGEINLPVNRIGAEGYDGRAFKAGAQIRKYFNHEKKFRRFWGLELGHRTEQYSKSNDTYHSSTRGVVNYHNANIKSVINTIGLHFGGQRVFASRFVFEWNLGAGLANKSVDYFDVLESQTYYTVSSGDMFGIGDFFGSLGSALNRNSNSHSTDSNVFTQFSDEYEKRACNLAIFGNFKIGYLLVSK
jgi:hypothetical protein